MSREHGRGIRGRFFFAKGESGAAIVEFSVIIALFIGLVLGIMEFSRFINTWLALQHAARAGARYAVTGRSDCLDEGTPLNNRIQCIKTVTELSAVGLLRDAVTVQIRSWEFPNYPEPPTEDSPGGPCDAFEVTVFYPFEFVAPIVSNVFGTVTIKGRERMLIEPFGKCE